jgi:MFS family permease
MEYKRSPEDTEKKDTSFSNLDEDFLATGTQESMPKNGTLLILTICLVNLFANSAYSQMAPFYPRVAVGKGVPESMIGVIFSSYSLAMFLFSPLYKKMLDRFGSSNLLFLGLVCEGVAELCMGCFDMI